MNRRRFLLAPFVLVPVTAVAHQEMLPFVFCESKRYGVDMSIGGAGMGITWIDDDLDRLPEPLQSLLRAGDDARD